MMTNDELAQAIVATQGRLRMVGTAYAEHPILVEHLKALLAEQLKRIRVRQANCKHAFIRGIVDREAHCVHCGLPQSSYQPPLTYTWNGSSLIPSAAP